VTCNCQGFLPDEEGSRREGRQGVSPEEIVEAIWACWEKHLGDWDLEGSVANAQARRLAVEAVAEMLAAGTSLGEQPHDPEHCHKGSP
jgi:hypothetical protein